MTKKSPHAANNRSNQLNRNNSAFWKSRGHSGVPKGQPSNSAQPQAQPTTQAPKK